MKQCIIYLLVLIPLFGKGQFLDSLVSNKQIISFEFTGKKGDKIKYLELKKTLKTKGNCILVFESSPSKFVCFKNYLLNFTFQNAPNPNLHKLSVKDNMPKREAKIIRHLRKIVDTSNTHVDFFPKKNINASEEMLGLLYYYTEPKKIKKCAMSIFDSAYSTLYDSPINDSTFLLNVIKTVDGCNDYFYDYFRPNQEYVKKIIVNIKGSLGIIDFNELLFDEYKRLMLEKKQLIFIRIQA